MLGIPLLNKVILSTATAEFDSAVAILQPKAAELVVYVT
jgi:hypothetical protein